jgi:hypothetical protein
LKSALPSRPPTHLQTHASKRAAVDAAPNRMHAPLGIRRVTDRGRPTGLPNSAAAT